MEENGGTIQETATSFDSIASEAFASLDGTGGEQGTTADAAPAQTDGDPKEAAQPASAEEGGTPAVAEGEKPDGEADTGDFLTASGVTLEEMLDGITDEAQRSFIERRYKEMQAHFSRRTQELSERDREAGSVASENEELKRRLAELEQRLGGDEPAKEQPDDWRQRFINDGLGDEISVEDAVTDPTKLVEFIRQQAIRAARENDLVVLQAMDKRLSPLEGVTYESVQRASQQKVDSLFAPHPEYRTPQNEQKMATLVQQNPALTLEQAFEVVVGPQLRADAARFGQRLGEVSERKRRASVPSSSAPGSTGVQLPDKPKSLDEIIAYANEKANLG